MFLFTTPADAPRTAAEQPVNRALRTASDTSGVPFDYLLATARRESGLNPTAKARTSSATGLFQFIEQTWLGLVREAGGAFGLGDDASRISAGGTGRFSVADRSTRDRILALRNDPEISAGMAAVLARKNYDGLSRALGRTPSQGELYLAHFLGLAGATSFIRAAGAAPGASAATRFPAAAAANEAIFYDRRGRERSLSQVYSVLVKGFEPAAMPAAVAATEPAAAAPEPVARLAEQGGNAFHGLFQSGARRAGGALAPSTPPVAARAAVGMPLDLLSFRQYQG